MWVICFFLVKGVDRALEKAAYISRLRELGPNVVRKGCEIFLFVFGFVFLRPPFWIFNLIGSFLCSNFCLSCPFGFST